MNLRLKAVFAEGVLEEQATWMECFRIYPQVEELRQSRPPVLTRPQISNTIML
jgi:hypothetical protein